MLENALKKLSSALSEMQSVCIGLFYNTYTKSLEPVVDIGENTFVTVTVGSLFGMNTDYHPISEDDVAKITKFPEGKTLAEMLNKPYEFYEWFNTLKDGMQ